jgi:hypothetical protein
MSANTDDKDDDRTRTQRLVLELAAVRERLEDAQRRASKPRATPPTQRPSVRPPPTTK